MPKRRGAKPKRAPRPKPRQTRKDEKGIPLTSDQPRFAILPSDFAQAMRPPPEAPTKATRRVEAQQPTTVIPELNALTPFAYQTVLETIQAADRVQIKRMNPTGGPNLRYRIEIAAAFLTHVMEHAYDAAVATKVKTKPEEFVNLALNIAIRRAQEIYGQSGA